MSLADWEIGKQSHLFSGYLKHTDCTWGFAVQEYGVWLCVQCHESIPIEILRVATLVGAKDDHHKRIHYVPG